MKIEEKNTFCIKIKNPVDSEVLDRRSTLIVNRKIEFRSFYDFFGDEIGQFDIRHARALEFKNA